MSKSVPDRFRAWGVGDLLARFPGLRIDPSADGLLRFRGELTFAARGPDGTHLTDLFRVEIAVPHEFPAVAPAVRETDGRIPEGFHKLSGNRFCLGSPTAVRLRLLAAPTLVGFVERLVIPYLFGFAYFERHGRMPFGELEHGADGIRQHLAELFGMPSREAAVRMAGLVALRKRVANKHPCPCGSGHRLGRCHHRRANRFRSLLGRAWFKAQVEAVDDRPRD